MVTFRGLKAFAINPAVVAEGEWQWFRRIRISRRIAYEVSALLGHSPSAFRRYLAHLSSSGIDEHVRKCITNSQRMLPPGSGLLNEIGGWILYAVARTVKPKFIVGTGVSGGVSSTYLLAALEHNKDGFLYSLDLPTWEESSHLPLGWIVPSRLRGRWILRRQSSCEALPQLLSDLGEVDMFFHDSEHTVRTMLFEYETAWGHLKAGGVLLSDDVHATNAFAQFAAAKAARCVIFEPRFCDVGGLRKLP